jgi:hypothetical protein
MSGAELTRRALVRHLAAVSAAAYQLRLIDGVRQCRASRIWSAAQLSSPSVVAWLRAQRRRLRRLFPAWPGTGSAGYVVSLRPGQQPDQLTAGELRGLLSARTRAPGGIGRWLRQQ